MAPGRTHLASSLLIIATAAGCGGSQLPGVTGKVTIGGSPVVSGTMTFLPKSGSGAIGYATIRSDGTFTAHTGDQAGLAPGEYTVTITAIKELPPATKENPVPKAEWLVPPRYGDAKTTDQKITVQEKGENHFDLPLKP